MLPPSTRADNPLNKSRPSIGLAIEESERHESTVVPPNEGNEVTRDERETSELDVVPMKWGNEPDGPHGGKEEPGSGNRKGER